MADDAETRAREWLIGANLDVKGIDPVWLDTTTEGTACLSSLAVVLRAERERTLAEVRREIKGYAEELLDLALGYASDEPGNPRGYYQREAAGARGALARLEKL